ncbi:MAG: hypothetical protein V3T22_11800 [Planctomycetota bacterium]
MVPHEQPDTRGDWNPRHARSLLRKLRDLNLAVSRVSIQAGVDVAIRGCLSLDALVERGVRYRLQDHHGERVLSLSICEGGLEIKLSGPTERRLEVELTLDGSGRTAAPGLVARLDVEQSDPRAFEHFLRRVVRGVYAA